MMHSRKGILTFHNIDDYIFFSFLFYFFFCPSGECFPLSNPLLTAAKSIEYMKVCCLGSESCKVCDMYQKDFVWEECQ